MGSRKCHPRNPHGQKMEMRRLFHKFLISSFMDRYPFLYIKETVGKVKSQGNDEDDDGEEQEIELGVTSGWSELLIGGRVLRSALERGSDREKRGGGYVAVQIVSKEVEVSASLGVNCTLFGSKESKKSFSIA